MLVGEAHAICPGGGLEIISLMARSAIQGSAGLSGTILVEHENTGWVAVRRYACCNGCLLDPGGRVIIDCLGLTGPESVANQEIQYTRAGVVRRQRGQRSEREHGEHGEQRE